MEDLAYIEQVKLALQSIDYQERLKAIYTLVEIGDINQEQFVTLINFSVDLDLVPTED